MKIMPSDGAHPPHQKHVLFPFVLWGQKCCNVTAAQIQFWISLSTRIPSYPNTMRIAINWATLDNLLQQKKGEPTHLPTHLPNTLPTTCVVLIFKIQERKQPHSLSSLSELQLDVDNATRTPWKHRGLNVMLVSITVHYRVPIWILSTNHRITGRWVFWSSHSATIWEFRSSAFSARGTTTI